MSLRRASLVRVSTHSTALPLLDGAPPRRPAPDCPSLHRGTAARARLVLRAVRDDLAGVDAAAGDRAARGLAQLAAQGVEVLGGQLAGRPRRARARLPQRLVGEEVADAGEHRLVEQAGLDRRRALPDPGAEVVARDLGG